MTVLPLRGRGPFAVDKMEMKQAETRFLAILDSAFSLFPPCHSLIRLNFRLMILKNISYRANDPNSGLSANKDLKLFKLFVGDTELFTTLMFKDKDFTENEIYDKLLNDKLSANLGYLYENAIAQTLAANGNELFYHCWRKENSKHNYEIDFLITRKNKICPIEVKSSGYKTHISLDEFCRKFSSRISEKYIVYTRDLAKDTDILYIPMYMASLL